MAIDPPEVDRGQQEVRPLPRIPLRVPRQTALRLVLTILALVCFYLDASLIVTYLSIGSQVWEFTSAEIVGLLYTAIAVTFTFTYTTIAAIIIPHSKPNIDLYIGGMGLALTLVSLILYF